MSNKIPSVVTFALFAAVAGSVGAAVLSHPHGKKISEHLQEVGDDIVDALDRAVDSVQSLENSHQKDSVDITDVALALIHELQRMNSAGHYDVSPVPITEKVKQSVSHEIEHFEERVDDITERIQWLQRQGRILAKRVAHHSS